MSNLRLFPSVAFPQMRGVDGGDPVSAVLRRPLPLVQLILPDEAAPAPAAVADPASPTSPGGMAVQDGAALVADVAAVVAAGADVRGPAAPAVAEHVPESAPEPLGHDAVEQRVDAAAEVVSNS